MTQNCSKKQNWYIILLIPRKKCWKTYSKNYYHQPHQILKFPYGFDFLDGLVLFFGNMYSLQNYFKFDTNHFLKKIEIPVKKINLPSILLEKKKNSLEQKFLIFIILRIIFLQCFRILLSINFEGYVHKLWLERNTAVGKNCWAM